MDKDGVIIIVLLQVFVMQNFLNVFMFMKPPPPSTWNGPLLGYWVSHRNFHTGSDWLPTELEGYSTTATQMDGFVLGQTYEFQVQTYNAIGRSDWSSGVIVFMEFGRRRLWEQAQGGSTVAVACTCIYYPDKYLALLCIDLLHMFVTGKHVCSGQTCVLYNCTFCSW